MIDFYTRLGPYLLTHGNCQEETKDRVFVPDGAVVVFEPAPSEALAPPPTQGARWNLDDHCWDEPEITTEQAWAQVRYERNRRLDATEWIASRARDWGEPVPPEWLAYRQALRDVTGQGDPMNIEWPEPPG